MLYRTYVVGIAKTNKMRGTACLRDSPNIFFFFWALAKTGHIFGVILDSLQILTLPCKLDIYATSAY